MKFIKGFFNKKKNSEDERQPEERRQIDLESLPKVCLPLITLNEYGNYFYAQINVKSYVVSEPNWTKNIRQGNEPKLYTHQGFLFEIRENVSQPPEINVSQPFDIKMIGIPLIFHPHFSIVDGRTSKWEDYERHDKHEKLEHCLLRIAHSLNYEKNYIHEGAKTKGNLQALEWYLKNTHKFPVNKKIWADSVVEEREGLAKTVFEINSEVKSTESFPRKMKKKFQVKKTEPAYNPEYRELPQFQILDGYSSNFHRACSACQHSLYLQNNAFETIKRHIGWDAGDTSYNIVEQGGILLGKTFIDNVKGSLTYGVVEQAIEGKLARGTSGYLDVTHETWKEMYDKADELVEQSGSELQIIGWYHTHPNTLDVFMSGTDQATQSRLFGNDWQFAIVLNPQRKIWRAFYGSHSEECQGYVVDGEERSVNNPKS